MPDRPSIWLANGIAVTVTGGEATTGWGPAPAGALQGHVEIHPLDEAPAEAALSSRPDLRFLETVAGGPSSPLVCFVGPGIQAYTAALQLACSRIVWERGGMLIHGAGLAHPTRGAVAALAVSGGGKSTLSNLADGFVGLSDETVLLWEATPPRISATPFRSTSTREPHNRAESLRALLILEKSLEPRFERVPSHEGVKRLLAQAYELPVSVAPRAEVFRRASALAETVPTFRFAFPKAPAARDLLVRLFDQLGSPEG